MSTQDFLLNPTIFSHTGMRQWRENYKSKTNISISKTTENLGNGISVEKTTTTRTTTSTWDEMQGIQTAAEIKDVRPFFFIGPRIQTNFRRLGDYALVPVYGLNAGFRCGTFYINGIFDKGDIYFREPYKRNEKSGNTNVNEARRTRLDGYFTNSTRFGGEIGLDLITHFIRSGFVDQASFATKTSYYGFIIKVGYFQQNYGALTFFSDKAGAALDEYVISQGTNTQATYNDARLAPSSIKSYSVGATFSVGSIAFNYDFYYFKNNRPLSHNEFSISYHYPIIRLFKAANVFTKENRYKKRL